jgi:hypothetical protein
LALIDGRTAMVTSFVAVPPPRCARCDDVAGLGSHEDVAFGYQCVNQRCPTLTAISADGPDKPPKMPPGFTVTLDDKGPRN